MWILVALSLLCAASVNCGELEDANTEPQHIQQPAGYDVRLNCGLNERHAVHLNRSAVRWDYKRCERMYNHLSCADAVTRTRPWTPLQCEAAASCGATLVLAAPTAEQSGLYRCSVQPYRPDGETTLQILMVKAYQLDVINLTIAAPQIVDDLPANATSMVGGQVVMQCRVRSKVMPTIRWFRKQDPAEDYTSSNATSDDNDDDLSDGINATPTHNDTHHSFHGGRVVQFLDNTYEKLESAGEMGLPNDTYLSKLIFQRVAERDAGIYVCVAINYRGYALRETVLEVCDVVATASSTTAADEFMEDGGQTQLMLLFLIPVGLAMMPLLMWSCYLMCRSRRSREAAEASRRAKITEQAARKYSLVCQNEIYV